MSILKNIFKKEPEVCAMVNITDIGPISCDPRYKNTLEMASDRIRSLKDACHRVELERDNLKEKLDALLFRDRL